MSAKQGKPIKHADVPIVRKGDMKAPRNPSKSDQRDASNTPGGTKANKNTAR